MSEFITAPDSKRMAGPFAWGRLLLAIVVYIAAVVAANIVTDRLGLVTVGFGLYVTAGTYAAGFALLARDFVHRYGNRWIAIGTVLLAGGVSWLLASPALAVASVVAFLAAEFIDLAVFIPVRNAKGFVQGAIVSNVVSAPVDTLLFLSLAGFPITAETVGGQFLGKVLWATFVPLCVFMLIRRFLGRGRHA
ncbi:VUT family protein [Nocardioides yefusunii]|uniref:VUT family protein n=1 Tax=Nocardioides yefusunii TaxID=2500546 RepID=A0ABW1R258_9ACTN|nr:VUT family protein [Nocardioides yefusunii]